MTKPQHGYAIRMPNGEINTYYIRNTPDEAKIGYSFRKGDGENQSLERWDDLLYPAGCRCVRVEVKEVKK